MPLIPLFITVVEGEDELPSHHNALDNSVGNGFYRDQYLKVKLVDDQGEVREYAYRAQRQPTESAIAITRFDDPTKLSANDIAHLKAVRDTLDRLLKHA